MSYMSWEWSGEWGLLVQGHEGEATSMLQVEHCSESDLHIFASICCLWPHSCPGKPWFPYSARCSSSPLKRERPRRLSVSPCRWMISNVKQLWPLPRTWYSLFCHVATTFPLGIKLAQGTICGLRCITFAVSWERLSCRPWQRGS